MWKKILEFILKKIIIPLLREILIFIFKELASKVFHKIKELLKKWRDKEKKENPEKANDIDKKYDEYFKDIENLEKEICNEIPTIVNEGTVLAEKKGTEILDEHKTKQIESKKNKDDKIAD